MTPANRLLIAAHTLGGGDRALREVEPSAAPHHVGDHQRSQGLVDSRPDAVQQLKPGSQKALSDNG